MTTDASVFPLGVYMAGAWLPGRNGSIWVPINWPATEQRLDALQAHHVNAIWLTTENGAEAGQFATLAAARGIRIIASLTEFNCRNDYCLNQTVDRMKTTIANSISAYGSAPRPLAWGLGDEPRSGDTRWQQWVNVWKTYYPTEPITTVYNYEGNVAGQCPLGGPCALNFLAFDLYPFFSQGDPYGYYTTGNPYPRYTDQAEAWEYTYYIGNIVGRGASPWAMGQIYQEPWGPYSEDTSGNIVIQPGGGLHWIMPSQAQVKWQAWAGLAIGAKGMWYYIHFQPLGDFIFSNNNLPSKVKVATNPGSPMGMVYSDGRTTPQFEALGAVYNQLGPVGAAIQSSVPATSPTVSIVSNSANDPTALAKVVKDPATSKCWVVVVGGYQGSVNQNIIIQVGTPITGLVSLLTGNQVSLTGAQGALQGTVSLSPGEGDVYECQTNTSTPTPTPGPTSTPTPINIPTPTSTPTSTLSNGLIVSRQGVVFNGTSDTVNLGTVSGVNFTQSYTVAMWLKASRLGDPASNCSARPAALWTKTGGGAWSPEVWLYGADVPGRILFTHSATDSTACDLTSTTNVATGTWYHVITRRDLPNNTLTLYINGSEQSSKRTAGKTLVNPNANNLVLGGGEANCSSSYLQGNLDDVRVYNRALTTTEITQLYQLNAHP